MLIRLNPGSYKITTKYHNYKITKTITVKQTLKLVKKNKVQFAEICKFPAVSRDLALLLDKAVEFEQVEQIARATEKKLLKSVELFDVYEGKNLPAGKKSYAVNFILQDDQRTLQDKQIDAIMNKLMNNLKTNLNAEIR